MPIHAENSYITIETLRINRKIQNMLNDSETVLPRRKTIVGTPHPIIKQ